MIELLLSVVGQRGVDALAFLLAFALTALMDSVFHDRLPHDHGRVDVFHRCYHDLLQDGWNAQGQHHLHGMPQRYLFAPAHLRRELLKGSGHWFSLS